MLRSILLASALALAACGTEPAFYDPPPAPLSAVEQENLRYIARGMYAMQILEPIRDLARGAFAGIDPGKPRDRLTSGDREKAAICDRQQRDSGDDFFAMASRLYEMPAARRLRRDHAHQRRHRAL